ncbi:1526_t:CDS:1 [Diversispora eburnea]|uniref:1526_t:CDS:1 n=1 Tax=Diversispora eburnea TaxID=1213867 RepID=A0A9N9BU07_9GLOM|nr:1526_t:CDS:1 [Diversispora eburnea]
MTSTYIQDSATNALTPLPQAYLTPTTQLTTSLPPTEKIIQLDNKSLPSYEHVKVDMPPEYSKEEEENEFYYPSKKKLNKIQPESPWDIVPVEEQELWPITKRLYVAGFLIWPLWYIGMAFSIFGKDSITRIWGKRCFINSLVVTGVYIYIAVAYFRTKGTNNI